VAINYGDWQSMPDYRDMSNKNASSIARLGRALDPMTYIPGIKEVVNPIHDVAEAGADGVNQVLSPVVGALQEVGSFITPGLKQTEKMLGLGGLNRFIRDKPLDAAAIAAATFFSAGAATPALTGAATGGTLGAAGTAAGSSVLAGGTTAGAAGSGLGAAGSAAATSAITPAFSSGAIAAGSAAPTALGVSGTAAATSALTPALASLGTAGTAPTAAGSLLNTFKGAYDTLSNNPIYKGFKTAKSYKDNLSGFETPDFEQNRNFELSNQLAQRILNDNPGGRRGY
jgi:hypothetical protein